MICLQLSFADFIASRNTGDIKKIDKCSKVDPPIVIAIEAPDCNQRLVFITA